MCLGTSSADVPQLDRPHSRGHIIVGDDVRNHDHQVTSLQEALIRDGPAHEPQQGEAFRHAAVHDTWPPFHIPDPNRSTMRNVCSQHSDDKFMNTCDHPCAHHCTHTGKELSWLFDQNHRNTKEAYSQVVRTFCSGLSVRSRSSGMTPHRSDMRLYTLSLSAPATAPVSQCTTQT